MTPYIAVRYVEKEGIRFVVIIDDKVKHSFETRGSAERFVEYILEEAKEE